MNPENITQLKAGTKLPGKVLNAMPSVWQTQLIDLSNSVNAIAEGDDPDTSTIVKLSKELIGLWRDVEKAEGVDPRVASFVGFVMHSAMHAMLDVINHDGASWRRTYCKSVVNALWRIMNTELKEFNDG